MNKKVKLVIALLTSAFCLSVCTYSAFAVDLDGDGYDDETGQLISTESPYTDPIVDTIPAVTDPIDTTPVVTDPVVTDPIYTESTTLDPYYTLPYTEVPTYPGYEQYTTEYIEYTYQSTTQYIGGGQTYVEPVSTAPPAPLFDSRQDIDDSELSAKDWKSIAANLSNSDKTGNVADVDDFSFIKNNDSKNDNGEWMLIVGICCLVLSAVGIIYVITSTVNRRKQLGVFTNTDKQVDVTASDLRSSDDYSDNFGVDSKTKNVSVDESSKFDTAEVKLPKGGSRYKKDDSKGGKRFR